VHHTPPGSNLQHRPSLMSFASNPTPLSMDRHYGNSSFDEVEADMHGDRRQESEDRAYPSVRPKLGCRKNCMLSCALGGVLCAKRCDVGSLTAQVQPCRFSQL
jgi:hypothetical protein